MGMISRCDLEVSINEDGTVDIHLDGVDPAHVSLLFSPEVTQAIVQTLWHYAVERNKN